MKKFVLKRVLKGILCVWFIYTLIFFLVRLTGDPTEWMYPDGASDEVIANLRAALHLDEPMHQQYIRSITDLLKGNAGKSYYYKQDVAKLYGERLGTTLRLALPALTLATLMGILLGTLAVVKRNSAADRLIMGFALLFHTMPGFCVGIIMIFIFSMTLRILPSSGTGSILNMIMPMITLAVGPTATVSRLTRSSLLDAMNREYMNGARMKGVKEAIVIIRHALRNSLIPVVTSVGLQLGTIIGGAVVVETVFTWPGMGMLLVTAAKQRDFPLVQYGVLLVAVAVTLANILIDISYGFLDPRIRENFK